MPAAARKALGVLNTQIAVYGTQAATAILAARILGPQQRGVMVVAVFVAVLIASAADFGLSDAVAYNIARQHGDRNSMSEARSVCVRWVPVSIAAILLVYLAVQRFAHSIVIRDLGPEVVVASCTLS
ncbi:MAG: hypothetical protein KGK12_14700, partial [Armatimonadetes bacterium]|nr:hypothetical protein [Armatimonadota bacterium]